MLLEHSQAYPPFSQFRGGSAAPPCSSTHPQHLPCEGWRHFNLQGPLSTSSTGDSTETTVIPSCCCASADSEREAGRTRPAPSRSSPHTCHPSRLTLLCPCHSLMLGRIRKRPRALHREDMMGSWAEVISKRLAAPHSLGIPESPASGASPQHNHTGLSPAL